MRGLERALMFSSRVRNKPFRGGQVTLAKGFMKESLELIRDDCATLMSESRGR